MHIGKLVAGAVMMTLAASPSAARADHGRDPWLARDKALHLGVSAALAGAGYGAGALLSERTAVRLALGAGLALTAGVAKEVRDRYGPGDASWRDLTADVVGTATGVAIAWLIDRYVR